MYHCIQLKRIQKCHLFSKIDMSKQILDLFYESFLFYSKKFLSHQAYIVTLLSFWFNGQFVRIHVLRRSTAILESPYIVDTNF